MKQVTVWEPQPGPQEAFVGCPVQEIFFGGARGGGKSDATLGRLLLRAIKYKRAFKGFLVRRELVQLEPMIQRSKEIYSSFGTYNEQKKLWTFKSGGVLQFRPIEKDSDAESFQGSSATDLAIEEIGNFPDLKPLLKLKGILRSASGVPVSFASTGNPGGPGHSEVKRRYIDPAPKGWEILKETDELTGLVSERIYIPSRITDNVKLLQNDPGYLARLAQTGSEALVRAWLDGDFSQIDGAYFSEFGIETHVIPPCDLPGHWTRFRAIDWGSFHPFWVGWFAVASEDYTSRTAGFIPAGALVMYREWYGSAKDNNEGIKMTAEEVGVGIMKRTPKIEDILYTVMDPKAFARDGGPSVAQRMMEATEHELSVRRADNKRVGVLGAMGGWDTLRNRLRGSYNERKGTVLPQLYFFSTCKTIIRTLPLAQHDTDKPEDLRLPEDHALDGLRYACMSRPVMSDSPKAKEPGSDLERGLLHMFDIADKARGQAADWRV